MSHMEELTETEIAGTRRLMYELSTGLCGKCLQSWESDDPCVCFHPLGYTVEPPPAHISIPAKRHYYAAKLAQLNCDYQKMSAHTCAYGMALSGLSYEEAMRAAGIPD